MNGLIVAGGDIDDRFACDLIKSGAFEVIFAVDRGVDMLYRNHITPDVLVGDFDSANPEALEYYRDMDQVAVSELDSVKDDTDTEHAIRDAIRLGCSKLTVIGGFGTRVDHMLANISLLGIGLEYGTHITILDANNRIQMFCESFEIKKEEQYGEFVSIIPYSSEVTGLSISGMKYNLENATMNRFSSLGISNEIEDEVAKVIFEDGIVLLVEAKDA